MLAHVMNYIWLRLNFENLPERADEKQKSEWLTVILK